MSAFGILWFALVAVLIFGYFALDGFDLGAGVLSPFVAKSEEDERRIIRAIGPVWDGNEVWILTAGGALFAAFAPAYATVFSGFYLAIMLVLMGLILRAVSIEFLAHNADFRPVWKALFFIGSLLPALLLGVAVGNIIEGIPMNAHGDYIGGFFALLNPFALLCGVLGLVHMLTQGASWLALKAPIGGELRANAAKMRGTLALVDIIVFALVTALFFLVVKPGLAYEVGIPVLAGVGGALFVAAMALAFVASRKGEPSGDLIIMLACGVACLGLVIAMAATLFPNIVPATQATAQYAITIATAAGSDLTLTTMSIIALIGVPLVLVYHVVVYYSFRGRVK